VVFAYHIVDVISLSFFRYWKLNSAAGFPIFFFVFCGLCSLRLAVFVATATVVLYLYLFLVLLLL